MKSVNGITKLVAAATALSITFAMVWSIANLGQPGAAEMRIQLAKPATPSVEVFDVIDGKNGGFVSPECDPKDPPPRGHCYDTTLPGNGNGGHEYGTRLSASEKDDLIAYLLTF